MHVLALDGINSTFSFCLSVAFDCHQTFWAFLVTAPFHKKFTFAVACYNFNVLFCSFVLHSVSQTFKVLDKSSDSDVVIDFFENIFST